MPQKNKYALAVCPDQSRIVIINLPAKKRREAYEYALKRYKKCNYLHSKIGVCAILDAWLKDNGYLTGLKYYIVIIVDSFPEFAQQRPEQWLYGAYWWPLSIKGVAMRIEALENAIKLLNIPEDGKII